MCARDVNASRVILGKPARHRGQWQVVSGGEVWSHDSGYFLYLRP